MTPEWVEALGTIACAVVGAAAVWVAYAQLSNLNSSLRLNSESLRMSALGVLLQLESEMNARKSKADELAAEIQLAAIKDGGDSPYINILSDHLKGCLENWINAADRLAYCISKGYFPERDWRAEYRAYFSELIKNHGEYFGPATIFTNLVDLNYKWKRE